jgi:ATP-dependent Lhr-like helicase
MMDTMMLESALHWIGDGQQRVLFCHSSELDLPGQRAMKKDMAGMGILFPGGTGRANFSALLAATGEDPARLASRLWEGVWKGEISNDTFMALRRGIENEFKLPGGSGVAGTMPESSRRRGARAGLRTGFTRWKAALPYAGNWFTLHHAAPSADLLEEEELKKERVRVLLDRYGIVFRELLQKELPPFRWSGLFRTMRLMELSGEIMAGCFFEGLTGPQFITSRTFRMLGLGLSADACYFMNALDPASLCGIPLHSLRGALPGGYPAITWHSEAQK